MIHQTKAIVLKHTKYGDSSLIVQLFTETLGLISIIAKGARNSKKNKTGNLYQIGNLLEIVLFYHPNKNFQIVNEVKIAYMYQELNESMVHNCIMQFAIENVQQMVERDTPLEELFYILYDFLVRLDKVHQSLLAHVPLYFLLALIRYNGYSIVGAYSTTTPIFDLYQGKFVASIAEQTIYIDGEYAQSLSVLNEIKQFEDILLLNILKAHRQYLIDVLIKYMQIHIPNYKPLKSLGILNTILN